MQSRAMQTPPRQTAAGLAATAAAAAGRRASPSRTTTPSRATPTATDSPGNWRHPRMDEITRRRAANMFTESNIKTAIYNGLALAGVYVARTANGAIYQQICRFAHSLVPARYAPTLWLIVQLALLLNIARAFMPLFRQPDTMADIPLTPGQRKLLGLDPLRAAATPGAVFTTPPRYARTPSMSGSPAASGVTAASNIATGSRSSYAGSPITGSPLFNKTRAASGTSSPFSAAGSPFASPFQKGRRSSFGSPTALSGGSAGAGASSLLSDSTFSGLAPGTPSPSSGKRLSMGLNNKWLYEKGRRSSGGAARIY